jgi:PIN domain nuclease of toxin-antitoxin system
MAEAPILLATHVWIWVVERDRPRLATRAIEAASQQGNVLVSAISVWEVAMLEARDRIALARPVQEWVYAALRGPGVHLLGLAPEIAVESARPPGTPHAYPADRILIASACMAGARLATRDASILDYARGGHPTRGRRAALSCGRWPASSFLNLVREQLRAPYRDRADQLLLRTIGPLKFRSITLVPLKLPSVNSRLLARISRLTRGVLALKSFWTDPWKVLILNSPAVFAGSDSAIAPPWLTNSRLIPLPSAPVYSMSPSTDSNLPR